MSTVKAAEKEEKILLQLTYENEVVLTEVVSTSQLMKNSKFFEDHFGTTSFSRLKSCLKQPLRGESSLRTSRLNVETSDEALLRALLRYFEGHSCIINRGQFVDALRQSHAWALSDVEHQIADYLRKQIEPALKHRFNRHEPDSIEHLQAITQVRLTRSKHRKSVLDQVASTLEEGSIGSIEGTWNEHVFRLKDECSKWIVVAIADLYDRQPFMLPTELREDLPHACCPDHVMDTEASGLCPRCRHLRVLYFSFNDI